MGNDNCVKFDGLTLQIPTDKHRYHYVKAKVRVHRYMSGQIAILHGPRRLAVYDVKGNELKEEAAATQNIRAVAQVRRAACAGNP